jgi:hypothetical protein
MSMQPPDDLPIYRTLTGKDDANFCRRVSEALTLGFRLYGSPAATFNGADVVIAQAVVWPCKDTRPAAIDEPPRRRKSRRK